MKKFLLFLLLLGFGKLYAQDSVQGLFLNFLDYSQSGTIPFFDRFSAGPELPLPIFSPSVLKQYPASTHLLYGLDMQSGHIPTAKLEIDANLGESSESKEFTTLKIYGGTLGIDVLGSNIGIQSTGLTGILCKSKNGVAIENTGNEGYGIYQAGDGRGNMNYLKDKLGIGVETPSTMLDISGDLHCTGPSLFESYMKFNNQNSSTPYTFLCNNKSLNFLFSTDNGSKTDVEPLPNGNVLMTLNSDGSDRHVEIFGKTNTQKLDVGGTFNCTGPSLFQNYVMFNNQAAGNAYVLYTNNASLKFQFNTIGQKTSLDLPPDAFTLMELTDDGVNHEVTINGKTTTEAFKMPTDAGLNKVMVSDAQGTGRWADVTPWIDKYWKLTSTNDMYSQGRNVGIGTLSTDIDLYTDNKLSVVTNTTKSGIYISNSATGNKKFGLTALITDIGGDPIGGDQKSAIQNPGSFQSKEGIYAKVIHSNGDGAVIGIHSEVTDNIASSVPVYGMKSVINGSYSANDKYGLYSEIQGGQTTKKWSGYFKGGDLELNSGSFIIGTPNKRFMIGTNYTSNDDHSLYFVPENSGSWGLTKAMALKDNGSVFMSDSLYVNGPIYAREIEVNLDQFPIPDYVFTSDYKLLPLNELESYIKTNQHLPEVPSATDIKTNGANLGEMNMVLLKKVEELSLYVIELKKEINQLEKK